MFYSDEYDWVFTTAMRVNILDEGDTIRVLVTLPGVQKEAIKISVHDEFLNVKVEAPADAKDEAAAPHYIWREYLESGYERDIYVGGHLQLDTITAAYANGILTVTIQKEVPQTVPVQ